MQKTLLVSIVGVPNAGKSTLVNNLVKEKISAISSKPHTTREIVQGIVTEGEVQLIFLDTPGFMRNDMSVHSSGDVVCFIIDGLNPWAYKVTDKIKVLLDKKDVMIFINKVDAISSKQCLEIMEGVRALGYKGEIGVMAGMFRRGVEEFKQKLIEKALEYPWMFPADQKHTLTKEEIIKECVREKIFHIVYHELPYETEVIVKDLTFSINDRASGERIDVRSDKASGDRAFTSEQNIGMNIINHTKSAHDMDRVSDGEKDETVKSDAKGRKGMTWRAYVTIEVQKQSQQGMLVGARGSVIKKIGTAARLELVERFGPGHLFLNIAVARAK